jgi:hypothetical protein
MIDLNLASRGDAKHPLLLEYLLAKGRLSTSLLATRAP